MNNHICTQPCHNGKCRVSESPEPETCRSEFQGTLSSWEKSSTCPHSCVDEYTRKCLFPPCNPAQKLFKKEGECNGGRCMKAKWTQWSDWSKNDDAISTRWRECVRGKTFSPGSCEGPVFESKSLFDQRYSNENWFLNWKEFKIKFNAKDLLQNADKYKEKAKSFGWKIYDWGKNKILSFF